MLVPDVLVVPPDVDVVVDVTEVADLVVDEPPLMDDPVEPVPVPVVPPVMLLPLVVLLGLLLVAELPGVELAAVEVVGAVVPPEPDVVVLGTGRSLVPGV